MTDERFSVHNGEQLKRVYELARYTDENGDWLYGRRAIIKMVPNVTEWEVRKILEELRGVESQTPASPNTERMLEHEVKVVDHPKIVVQLPKLPAKKAPSDSSQTWVVGSDFHAPYEDERAASLFYQITNYLSPDRVTLLGDVINLDAFSRYDKIPGGVDRWIKDVSATGKILGNTKQAAPSARLEWVEGNHEERLKKHLMRHDPLLYSVLDMRRLFTLVNAEGDLADWDYIAKPEIYEKELNLVVAHGEVVRKHAAYTAKAHLEKLLLSVVIGHSHRLGVHHRSSGRSRYLNEPEMFAVENGCLCRYDQEYIGGSTTDWQQGFTVLNIDLTGEKPYVVPSIVKIDNGRAIFRGKTFTA